MTRFSQYCNILLDNMHISKKGLFHALFDWTDNNPSYFEGTVPYPFMDGTRPLPDVFSDAFNLLPNSFTLAKKCINDNFLKKIINESKLKTELIAFINKEINVSHEIMLYLENCTDDLASFYTCILYMVMTGNPNLPPLKNRKIFNSTLITNIPAPSPYFLGRETELQQIKTKLSSYGICYVWGISGIGKSDLVCKYVKLEKTRYANVVYIKFCQNLETSIAMIANLNDFNSYTVKERFSINSQILNSFKKDTLVVLDNFDICYENDPYFSWLSSCDFDLIITSRIEPIEIPSIHLTELTPAQSMELFKVHCDNNISEEAIQAICEKLVYHTLVTILVAKAITYTELSITDVMEALNKSLSVLPTKTKLSVSKDSTVKTQLYSTFIAELFTFANLCQKEEKLLCMLAVMPLEGISKAKFLAYTKDENLDIVNKFVRLGYIERGSNNVFTMHPLIADTCLHALANIPELAIKEILNNFFFDVYAQKTFPTVDEQLVAVSICEVILQHSEFELIQEMIDLTSFFSKSGQYLHTVDTTDYIVSHKDSLNSNEKDYILAFAAYYKGLAFIQLGNPVAARNNLSNAITILGDKENFSLHEAELFFNSVIENAACEEDPELCIEKLNRIKISKDCLPQNNYDMLLSRIAFKIASSYLLLGNYEKAIEIFNEALSIRDKVFGSNSISSGLAIGNIAYSFQNLGKYELAVAFYEKGIKVLSQHYPQNHMNLIRMHLNCAIAYYFADSIPSNKQIAEDHFDLAELSAENLVVENRSKKEKDSLKSSLNMQRSYISPSKVILAPVYNYAYDFDNERNHKENI